ncbi:hypothetical protein [Pseudomonas palmensis]|nr:hypothetical protein [Pseudomonas palmensis]
MIFNLADPLLEHHQCLLLGFITLLECLQLLFQGLNLRIWRRLQQR